MIVLTIILSVAVFNRWINLRFQIGGFYFGHLLVWIGSLYFAVYNPIYYILKRRNPRLVKPLIKLHTYGNLLAFMMVSLHNAQQLGRPAQFYPDLGTGISLYIIVVFLVITGFLYRYQLFPDHERLSRAPHLNRRFHIALTFLMYLTLIVHILKNIGAF
ncbi:hypothetical protein GF319_11440 [Candidatus Bathyarchaeota archaeon]|nr:hypothetical protein [Candidatus Bathyarchaeota archaeon]